MLVISYVSVCVDGFVCKFNICLCVVCVCIMLLFVSWSGFGVILCVPG